MKLARPLAQPLAPALASLCRLPFEEEDVELLTELEAQLSFLTGLVRDQRAKVLSRLRGSPAPPPPAVKPKLVVLPKPSRCVPYI